jgi:hypothetical protein
MLIESKAAEKVILMAYEEEQRIQRAQDKCASDPIVAIMLKHHRQPRFKLIRRLPGPQHCED